MIEFKVPELPERELTLPPDETFRGLSDPAPGVPLAGRVVLGGPLPIPVTPELASGDPDVEAFVKAEAATSVFCLLHLSLTCQREPREPPLHSVSVDLKLTAAPSAPFQPVALSMTPRRLTEKVQVTTAMQLGAPLAFVARGRTSQVGQVHLEALRELRSDPSWQIRHTRTVPIEGTYRFAVVVRAPRGAGNQAKLAVRATVRKGPVLRRFREELRDPVNLAVDL